MGKGFDKIICIPTIWGQPANWRQKASLPHLRRGWNSEGRDQYPGSAGSSEELGILVWLICIKIRQKPVLNFSSCFGFNNFTVLCFELEGFFQRQFPFITTMNFTLPQVALWNGIILAELYHVWFPSFGYKIYLGNILAFKRVAGFLFMCSLYV